MTEEYLNLPDSSLEKLGITTAEVITSIEKAVRSVAAGKLLSAPKSALVPGDGRYMMATLASSDDPALTVVKAVTVSPDNPKRNLETINGAIMVFDSSSGLLKAVLGANWITAVRTAGLSAVVAKRLANPESSRVAFVGTGVQARSHLDAFQEMFPLKEARVYGRGQANIDRLCDHAQSKGLQAIHCLSAKDAVEGADIVVSSVTVTYSGPPLVDGRWLKPGAFATITDFAKPWDLQGMPAFQSIVIDDHAQEAASPERTVPEDLVSCDLTELLSMQDPPGFSADQCSAFVFRGIALGDFALSALAYRKALKMQSD